ncbi:hypothetical protein GUJ93_ZPchr0002g25255 [Zizania palustris]|uniref:Uncharacterized protein n=1 Tax=Zizania palustris TaxID=103762 RepID=A0A8J5VEH0_ZIZPA|nr:hypothetical protein GUJ93_ZPchr0002g25255 [Zizania palustris]
MMGGDREARLVRKKGQKRPLRPAETAEVFAAGGGAMMDGDGEVRLVRKKGNKWPPPPAERVVVSADGGAMMDGDGEVRLVRKKGNKMPPPAAVERVVVAAGGDAMMDGDGEVRLVRKKGNKMPPPRPPQDREVVAAGRDRDRFDALRRDYHDLLKDTEVKKRRLESINRQNLRLLAEVKFLQKKFNSFKKDESQQTHYQLKKQVLQVPSHVGSANASAYHGVTTEVPSTSKRTDLDLNQYYVTNDELADCPRHKNHLELKNPDQAGVDEDIMIADVNLSACRDKGNSPVSDDKRSITWRDRVALKA